MHIAIDTHAVEKPGQGNATYFSGLVEGLAKIDSQNIYSLYSTRNVEFYRQFMGKPNFRVRTVYPPGLAGRVLLAIPVLTFTERIDVLHTQYQIPLASRCPVVVTIHDLYFEHYPQSFGLVHLLLSRLLVRWSARHANRIITISEYSAEDIHKLYGIPKSRIAVVPCGKSDRFAPVNDKDNLSSLRNRYAAQDGFILFVGRTDDPRKNVGRLIQAYGELKRFKKIRQKLIIVGLWGKRTEALVNMVGAIGLIAGLDVVFTGMLPESEVVGLMNAASVFVYPSFFEGFGLPVLEAMACGTPVVTSNVSSIPEIVGDAGLMVDPFDIGAIALAIERVLDDKHLQNTLSLMGIERAKAFSWEKAAESTLQVYQDVARV